MKRRNLGSSQVLIEDAIDMHVHYGPEPLVDLISGSHHSVDPISAAQEARDFGMRAIVLKPHEFPSTLLAHVVANETPGIAIMSGITLDHPVGGLNPHAVEVALRAGARVVWLPTVSSLTSVRTEQLFGTSERFAVTDANQALLPEAQEIIELVAEHGAVLATGHVTADEHFAVVSAMKGRGKVIVTHAMHGGGAGPELNKQQCIELAEMGAYIEFAAHTCSGVSVKTTEVADAIRDLPRNQVVLSSDFGWTKALPRPAAGLQNYVSQLWELGFSEQDLSQIASKSGKVLLDLD